VYKKKPEFREKLRLFCCRYLLKNKAQRIKYKVGIRFADEFVKNPSQTYRHRRFHLYALFFVL